MIITLKGTTFTHKLDLNSWMIISDLVGVTSSNAVTKVTKGDTYTTTFTIDTGYTLTEENVSVVCNGVTKTLTWDKLTEGGKATLSFAPDATVYISIRATGANSGGGEEPETPGSGEVVEPEIVTGTLPLVQYALSVVSGENFYQVGSKNTKRLSTSSITDATGIWIDAGATITLTGTSGLRFDYVYATNAGPNSNDKSVNTIGGVGTASNFATSNFFPLNADGSSNTISITNDNGTGYYYFFAMAAPNKTDEILVANYQGKITYTITPANDTPSGDVISSGTLFLQNGALSVVDGENFYVSLNSETSKTKRMNSSSLTEATGILVPNGKTIALTGTRGLRFDYIYATKPGPNSSTDKTSNVIGGVGTASNFATSNYFPLNADGSSNTISITNNYGQDYYYHFAIAGPTKAEVLNPDDYNITYVVS